MILPDPLTLGSLIILAASGPVSCELPQPVKINVTPKTKAVKYNYSKTLADLHGFMGDTTNPYGLHKATITQGYMSGGVLVTPQVKIMYRTYPQSGRACIWYDSIDVKIEIDPEITIAKEVSQNSCMFRAVKEHEMKHVDTGRVVVNEFSKIVGDKLHKAFSRQGFVIGPVPEQQVGGHMERMQKDVYNIVQREVDRMQEHRRASQAKIDTVEEYERVKKQCPHFDAVGKFERSKKARAPVKRVWNQ